MGKIFVSHIQVTQSDWVLPVETRAQCWRLLIGERRPARPGETTEMTAK